jgi:large subunit ribosomal protein L30
MIRIRQIRSVIRTTQHQRRILASLGLKKIGHSRLVSDTPTIMGMIRKVHHLISAEHEAH